MQEGAAAAVLGVEGLVDALRGEHSRQRQGAGGEALGQAQEVGRDAVHRAIRVAGLLAREQRAGTAEAHGDLIGDEVHGVLVAQRAQAAEVARVVHAHAAGALHQRFQDHRAHLAGVALQQVAQLAQAPLRAGARGFARCGFVGVGRGRHQRAQQQRGVGVAVQAHVAH